MAFLPTMELLAAVKARLAALQVTLGDGPVAAFEKVEYYDSDELKKAMSDLRIFKARVALIIPAGDDFVNEISGRVVMSRMTQDFDILIADRDYSAKPGQAAQFGGDKNVGVLALKDAVYGNLVGQDLGLRGVCVIPLNGGGLEFKDPEQKDSPGRKAWLASFSTAARDMRGSLPV